MIKKDICSLIYSNRIRIGISFSIWLQLLSYFYIRIKHTGCILCIFVLSMLYLVGHLFADVSEYHIPNH